ncbi:uncharacterized protein BT62DRAFT_1079786 [Guyanagaster necrorhizus]|uniref:Uncharacterized protein n=1 Tax=Guyanagaster necrorhizus TaxID=856835 RepID=A0A9P7VJH5_9AGAR|nr:uncharacterized protein BT62DRAFT_1079786 [Guyanagaster necrorhizus MCA 3950]KAG7441834.1 hypothetical protein BT62DRAFT_1079786 [Guyanagaster necrorhizus MCA 3950]
MSSTEVTFNRNEQLGSFLLSMVVSAVMYGITTFKVYVFFKQDDDRRKDSKALQGFASGTSLYMIAVAKCRDLRRLLDRLQQAFVAQGIYFYLVTCFDDSSILLHATWDHMSQVFVTAIINLLCQGYIDFLLYFYSRHIRPICSFLIRRIWALTPPERKRIAARVVCVIMTSRDHSRNGFDDDDWRDFLPSYRYV